MLRVLCVCATLLALLLAPSATAAATATPPERPEVAAIRPPRTGWVLPLPDATVSRAWDAPAGEYAAGHRGVDLRGAPAPSEAAGGRDVVAAADGVVAFAGRVVDRAVLTIDHGGGIVSTVEPVESVVAAGERVSAGDVVGEVSTGGHAVAGDIHFGVRVDGEYVDPHLFVGGRERAVLLPCC